MSLFLFEKILICPLRQHVGHKHILDEPIVLPCGYSVCQSCWKQYYLDNMESSASQSACPVPVCDEKHDFKNENCTNLLPNAYLIDLMQQNSKYLVRDAVRRLRIESNKFETSFERHVESIENELEIRIKKIKCEIDKIASKMNKKNRPKRIGSVIKKSAVRLKAAGGGIDKVEDEVRKLKKMFTVSDKSLIATENVGKVTFTRPLQPEDMNQSINHRVLGRIELSGGDSYQICPLPNGNLLVCNYDSFSIYDQSLTVVKRVENIDKQKTLCYFAVTNSRDRVYLSDRHTCTIIMTDLELNRLSSLGSPGTLDGQFNFPRGMYFHDQHLYVCDGYNKRIVKLTDDLQFVCSFSLNFVPCQIQIIANVACISDYHDNNFCFYEIITTSETKKLVPIRKHKNHGGTISVIDSYFYEYFHENMLIYCYDLNGEIVKEIETSEFNKEKANNRPYDGFMSLFHDKLLISFKNTNSLYLIDVE